MVEQHHNYTALILLLYAILILAGAIFLVVAYNRVGASPNFSRFEALRSARSYLMWAYILGFIASALGMILAFIYFGHIALGMPNEIVHFIVFFLLFALVIASGILAFIALSKINSVDVTDRNSSTGWIWAAEVVGLLALLAVVVSGAWRAQHYSNKPLVAKTTVTTTSTVAPAVVATAVPLSSEAPSYTAPIDTTNNSPVYATVTETKTERTPISLPHYLPQTYAPQVSTYSVAPSQVSLSAPQMFTPEFSVGGVPQYSLRNVNNPMSMSSIGVPTVNTTTYRV